MSSVFSSITKTYKDLDYVSCWVVKSVSYMKDSNTDSAFVATKTICQGIQVAMLWPTIFAQNISIRFAHRPFHWKNLAKSNAGVTCVIIGLTKKSGKRRLFDGDSEVVTENIGPYLIPMANTIVSKSSSPLNFLPVMDYGNKPSDGGKLILSKQEKYLSLIHI